MSRAGTAGQQPRPSDDVREAFFLREERIGSSDDVADEALSKAFSCKLVTDFLFWLRVLKNYSGRSEVQDLFAGTSTGATKIRTGAAADSIIARSLPPFEFFNSLGYESDLRRGSTERPVLTFFGHWPHTGIGPTGPAHRDRF